jgi:hypothetical protein
LGKLVDMIKNEMSIQDKAEFLIAIRNYKCVKMKKWSDGLDFFASDIMADEKVLVRLLEPRNASRYVSADDAKSMGKVMRREGCAKGLLVGKRFTAAAAQEMERFNIQQVSDEYMPPVKPENMNLKINDCINDLCKARCGAVPSKTSDCKAHLKGEICRVRSISDDARFHRERGWTDLLKNDLRQLLLLNKTCTCESE